MSNEAVYAKRWLITLTVMLVTVLEVLDMTIVNVSLPHMMGSLGADTDQITWVLTSYIVSSAILMPLTGFLVNRFGRKKLLLINIIGFLISSVLCGASVNLSQIVCFRTLQGVFGASLVPLSQFILRDTFPPAEQGKAMAIWGIGIMTGPILGPTIGGYITEILNWRWIFYINIPVCIIAWIMTQKLIEETPTKKQYIDWLGMFLMSCGVGCLQLFLDRGNMEDWFESKTIVALAIACVISLSVFIIRGLRKPDNIINLHLFKDRNFSSATLMMTLFCLALFSSIALNPIMLENLMGYPTQTAGWLMAPRGLASAIGMALVAQIITRYDARWIILSGVLLSAYGTYLMSKIDLTMSMSSFIISSSIQGFGMGLFFVPLSIIALSTLSKDDTAEGSGLFSFGRSIGSSIGISVMTTILSRKTQLSVNQLGAHINPFNPQLKMWLSTHGLNIHNPLTLSQLKGTIQQQASMLGFLNAYWITALIFVAMIPLIFILDKPDPAKQSLDFVH